jgi:hypothetical protein
VLSVTDTANLGLPCIEAAQAQKHVTHNEALRLLDTLVQLAVADRDLAAPPGSPADGQRWIVAASPTGAWAGHATHIATWQDGGWQFSAPRIGWVAYVVDEGTLVTWNGTAWGDFFSTVTAIQNLALLGVGTTADSTNPLSAKLNNALWVAKTTAEGGTGDLRYKLSKAASGNTLSFLLQDNFSGRAEIGLTGDDNLHVKVSADGSAWVDALLVQGSTGALSIASAAAKALAVGANGATNPALQVDASTTSVATGWLMKGAASGSGAALSVLSPATNENAAINAKGTGSVTIAGSSSGNVVVGANKLTVAPATGNTAVAGTLSVGGTGGNAQTSAPLVSRGSAGGNDLEFGHANAAGYGSALGHDQGGGPPFLAFCCEAGSTNSTFRTRGIKGAVMMADISGGFTWRTVANANADNQVATTIAALGSDGSLAVQGRIAAAAGSATRASINVAAGAAPASPSDGDIWYDGTSLKMRIGGATKTFTLV